MFLRILSDLHLEFDRVSNNHFDLPVLDTDKNTVLVLPGDIDMGERVRGQINNWKNRFLAVIFVPGNHEYYKGNFDHVNELYKSFSDENVFYLLDSHISMGDTLFIGSTLWSDFDRGNPTSMFTAQRGMNDYYLIKYRKTYEKEISARSNFGLDEEVEHDVMMDGKPRTKNKKMLPEQVLKIHRISRDYIFNTLKENKGRYKNRIVITHHLPSFQSIDPIYKTSKLNGAYASALDELIIEHEPTIWIHGHTHQSKNYNIGKTNILCNPRGYIRKTHNTIEEENKNFDPNFLIEV